MFIDMALSAPRSPAPGASPPSSPTPVPTPGPAATSPAASVASPVASAATSLPPAPVFPSTLSPSGAASASRGRSKNQRWRDSSPPSSVHSSPVAPSFRDVLLGGAAMPVNQVAAAAAVQHHPRIVLRTRTCARLPHPELDKQGWLRVQSRRTRKRLLRRQRGPRRQVPPDLRGKCFNCFSPTHRAADCRSRYRCFTCHKPGHRAFECRGQRSATSRPGRKRSLVWRRVSETGRPNGQMEEVPKQAVAVKQAPLQAAVLAAGVGDCETQPRRRRRRVRRRQGPPDSSRDGDDHAPPPEGAANAWLPDDPILGQPKPRRYIDRSAKIARAEDELRKALSVTIVGDSAAPPVDVLMAELARRYELPVESLQVHQLSPGDYLLILSDEVAAVQVYNGGRHLQLPPFTVVCRRWSRFKGASGAALTHLVDVELGGIPAHAWELETAEHLLDDWCWVRELHPDTINRSDYSKFRLRA
jgi:hypothetical protein